MLARMCLKIYVARSVLSNTNVSSCICEAVGLIALNVANIAMSAMTSNSGNIVESANENEQIKVATSKFVIAFVFPPGRT